MPASVLARVDHDELIADGSLKIECSIVWCFAIVLADKPLAFAWVTQSWTWVG